MTGGIGGLPATPIIPCGEPVPPLEPAFYVIQNEACRVDIGDSNSVYFMTDVDTITITTNGSNSPIVLNAPFAFPIQVTDHSIAISHPDLCEVEITSIEFDIDGDITVVTDGVGPNWTVSQYVASAVGTAPCELTITADNLFSLGEIAQVQVDVNGGGTLTFTFPFLPGDGNSIVITDPGICGETLDEIRLYLGLGTALVQVVAGPIVIPSAVANVANVNGVSPCKLQLPGTNLDQVNAVVVTHTGVPSPLTFNPFYDVGTPTEITNASGSLCGETVTQVDLYADVGQTILLQSLPGLNVLIPV